ncbi:Thermolabile hemolysin [Smittium culicis]|uniref:Thermolabile hemolysin n=1 Tax=Smittium culicis TaxID=133412 RepID=A0A1R1XXT8_9FUNG|nr:Thermolabile hemolysin [Smittium culicis]
MLVVFGNSLSDIGNLANSENPVPFWEYRFSNGPVWNEYLSYFNNYTLVNYAFGGATSNNTFVDSMADASVKVPSLQDQIGNFTSTFNRTFSSGSLDNDIAVVEIGSNDIFNLKNTTLAADPLFVDKYTDGMVANIAEGVKRLSAFGYKKFLVSDIPDLSKTPSILNYGANSTPGMSMESIATSSVNTTAKIYRAAVKNIVDIVNKKISAEVDAISKQKKDAIDYIRLVSIKNVIEIAVQPAISKMLNITVIDEECYPVNNGVLVSSCTNSDNYAYVDSVHPNTRVHALAASVFASVIKDKGFSVNESSIRSLIDRYDIVNAGARNNFLFSGSSVSRGTLLVDEYNMASATLNAKEIAKEKNEDSTVTSNSRILRSRFFRL